MRKSTALFAVPILFVLAWFAFPEFRQYATGQAVQAPAIRQTWEYDVIRAIASDVGSSGENELDRRGKQGWELCESVTLNDGNVTFLILKRPLQ
jgi:hypothetical protein